MELYHNSTIKSDIKILLRNFYVGITMPNRQILDFAAKGIFIESDTNFAYEMIERIVGVPPTQKGSPYTQEGIKILEKLGDMQKND